MNPAITNLIVYNGLELAKAALQTYFALSRQAGLSEEEAEELYVSTKARMAARPASALNKV